MSLRRMRHSERTAACLVHMSGVIPIWGALVMGGLLWRFRGRSRPTVFHAMQGIFFHLGFLLVETPALLLVGLGNMIGYLRPDVGSVVTTIAWYLVWAIFAANCVICLMGAIAVIDGRDFNYPFFGKRLRPPFEEPPPVRRRREFHTYMTPIPPADEFVTPLPKAMPKSESANDPAIEAESPKAPPESEALDAEEGEKSAVDSEPAPEGQAPEGAAKESDAADAPSANKTESDAKERVDTSGEEPSAEQVVPPPNLEEAPAPKKARRRRRLPKKRRGKNSGGS